MRYLSLSIFTVMLFACSDVSSPPDDVPKAFEEKNSIGGIKSSDSRYGGGSDVVNSMYNEIVDDDANLKSLEKDIRNIPGVIADAEGAYNNFVYNNSGYYNSATNHVNSIKDSALKQKIKVMLEASNAQYQRSGAKHNTLINEINWKQLTLNDLHTYLKIIKTIPAIEAYQKKNLPSTSPMENASAELDKLIQRTKDAGKQ
jgi:hypothetical protein